MPPEKHLQTELRGDAAILLSVSVDPLLTRRDRGETWYLKPSPPIRTWTV